MIYQASRNHPCVARHDRCPRVITAELINLDERYPPRRGGLVFPFRHASFDPLTDFPRETTDYFESTLRDASTHREISVSDNLIRRESGTKRFPHGRCFRSRSSSFLFLSYLFRSFVPAFRNVDPDRTRDRCLPSSTSLFSRAQLQLLPQTFRVLFSAFKSWKAITEWGSRIVAERVISIHKWSSRYEWNISRVPHVSRDAAKSVFWSFFAAKGAGGGMSIDLMGAPPVPRFKRHIKPPFLPLPLDPLFPSLTSNWLHPINDPYARAIVPLPVFVRARFSLENHVKVLSEAPRPRYLCTCRCLGRLRGPCAPALHIVISISWIASYGLVNSFI